jgi:hypothetical protein
LFIGQTPGQPGSGSVALSVTPKGSFSGKLGFEDGSARSIKGRFDANGTCTLAVTKGTNPVPLTLYLERGKLDQAGEITGFLSDPASTAILTASRSSYHAVNNPFSKEGRYTCVLPGSPGSTTEPGGFTHATVSVGKNGAIALRGSLGDGTAFTQKTLASRDGRWPLYARLYSGCGSILGWVSFEGDSETDLVGRLVWSRPPMSRTPAYPAGFVIEREIEGSLFTPPGRGQPIVDLPAAVMVFQGGHLAEPLENGLTFGPGGTVYDLGPNRLKASFNRSSGAFSGKVMEGARSLKFSGVLLQKQSRGAGLVRDQGLTGSAVIEAVEVP